MKIPRLLGHRGVRPVGLGRLGKSLPVENSLAAFEYALDHGCDGFEFDVRHSSDGRNVLWHDPDYRGLPIAASPYCKLADREGRPLPCLEAVLQNFGPRAYLDIELKISGYEPSVVAALQENRPQKGFLVSSFLPNVLQRVRELDASIPLGFLCDRAEAVAVWQEQSVEVFLPHDRFVTSGLIDAAHQQRLEVMTWTVNDRARMRQLAEWGIDGIISDDPEVLYQMFHFC